MIVSPYLKWAGGKSKLVTQIADRFGARCRGLYREPFSGALAAYLYLAAEGRVRNAVLTDLNPRLIATHLAVQSDVEDVIKALAELPTGEDWKESYYELRARFNEDHPAGPEFAALFIWINKSCFNGLFRENKKGGFNVPAGSYKRPGLPEADHLRAVSRLLQRATILCLSFDLAMAFTERHDHVYCDPPYVPLSDTADFTAFTKAGFSAEHQRKLSELGAECAHKGASVVLSNHDTPFIRDLYEPLGFTVDPIEVHRSISCKTRGKVTEALIHWPRPSTSTTAGSPQGEASV